MHRAGVEPGPNGFRTLAFVGFIEESESWVVVYVRDCNISQPSFAKLTGVVSAVAGS